jgi:hypothetical protein
LYFSSQIKTNLYKIDSFLHIKSITYILKILNISDNRKRKREQSPTNDDSRASMHKNHYWPTCGAMNGCLNPTYNCIHYELKGGSHTVASADVLGIYGEGSSLKDAVDDFCLAIKGRLIDKLGGIYPETSDFEFQESAFLDLEMFWCEDGVQILHKHRISISIIDGIWKSE